MKAARIALLSLVCLVPLAAGAQWQWLDNQGHKVFSDQAPPSDVPANRILRQPGSRNGVLASTVSPAVPGASAPVGVDPALKPAGKDKALEEKRKQAAAAEAEKKKEEEAKYAAARADNCMRAKSNKTTLESGQRIALTNDKGEKEYMTDEQRASELKRIEEIIARDCRADRQ